MSSFVTSLIRTWTPIVAGAIIGWAITAGLPVTQADKAGLTAVLAGVASALYYLAVREAEKRWPEVGWLLGVPKPPVYLAPREFVATTVPAAPVVTFGGSTVLGVSGEGLGGSSGVETPPVTPDTP
jgi:hypothetical protein